MKTKQPSEFFPGDMIVCNMWETPGHKNRPKLFMSPFSDYGSKCVITIVQVLKNHKPTRNQYGSIDIMTDYGMMYALSHSAFNVIEVNDEN